MGPRVPFIYHLALLCKNWKERNKKKAQGLGQRGFSIELSTAVAVVVTCRRNTNMYTWPKVVYKLLLLYGKTTSSRGLGLNLQIQ